MSHQASMVGDESWSKMSQHARTTQNTWQAAAEPIGISLDLVVASTSRELDLVIRSTSTYFITSFRILSGRPNRCT